MDYPLCWSPASVLMTLSARISLGIALEFTFIASLGPAPLPLLLTRPRLH